LEKFLPDCFTEKLSEQKFNFHLRPGRGVWGDVVSVCTFAKISCVSRTEASSDPMNKEYQEHIF